MKVSPRKNNSHFKIPERDARCSNCGKDPSSDVEWMIGTVETSFCRIIKATSLKESYGLA